MEYKKLAEDLISSCEEKECDCCEYADSDCECNIVGKAAEAITDLLSRAEAAEARCETLEKMVKEYQDELIPGYRERAEKAEENFSKSVDALKREREFAAEEREKREKVEKMLDSLSMFTLGRPIITTGQREVITFCGVPIEEAMQRVLDYPQLKKRAENIDKMMEDLLKKNEKIQSNVVKTTFSNVIPTNYGSKHGLYFEMRVRGFCKQLVFVFEDNNYSIQDLCKVISKTFTDMLREYEAKSESGEK